MSDSKWLTLFTFNSYFQQWFSIIVANTQVKVINFSNNYQLIVLQIEHIQAIMSNYFRTYSNLMQFKLLQIQPRRNQYQQFFIRSDQQQITQITSILTKNILFTPIQTLLKHIHRRYHDQGLQYSLIHKLFTSSDAQIFYYVPELVYIAIKKPCKPMKKLLIHRAKMNEALRRLILWNVKAFTVLMKQKDAEMKKEIQSFEQELTKHVKNVTKFNLSMKAIAMLTQASLTLKKMPVGNLKQKLQKFIRRYNAQILNNLQHGIIIPFRQDHHPHQDKSHHHYHNSNYVVHIVQEDCSCFPTRKRVPYRIIIETIDPLQLRQLDPSEKLFNTQKIYPDEQRDLFNEVEQSVQHLFTHAHFKFDPENIFVKDNEENKRISQMKNFVSKLQKEQIIKQQQQMMTKSKRLLRSMTLEPDSLNRKNQLLKYKIKPNQKLKRFDAIYISGKSPDIRRSQMSFADLEALENPFVEENLRKSGGHVEKKIGQIETYYEGQFKDWNMNSQSIWGQAWELKKAKYLAKSHFSNFKSLSFRNVVVKGGDDLRQEIICMQLIYKMRDIIKDAGVNLLIKPYEIIVLSENSGILQFVSNSISLDQMKKKTQGMSLPTFFTDVFQTQQAIYRAKQSFIKSLAGSSILTYVLKLKDRHNGNILIDIQGNIIHIDFGFILGMAPGNLNFESSPFKFTAEYVQLMGGKQSENYSKLTKLFCDGMMALRRRVDQLTLILQIMKEGSDLDCFKDFQIQDFTNSFKLHYSDDKYEQYCKNLVERSCMNSRTVHYDTFQYYSNGILP